MPIPWGAKSRANTSAAAFLRVSVRTVLRYEKAGLIARNDRGTFPRSTLRKFMAKYGRGKA